MQLTDLFDLSLIGRRDDIALEYEGANGVLASLTFGELDARANRLAHLLTDRGLKVGDRLAVHLPNRVEYVDLLLASCSLGVVLVPINVLYREREIAHMVTDAEPFAVVTTGSAIGDGLFPGDVTLWDVDELTLGAAAQPGTRVRLAIDGDAAAVIVYTSGTTGRSKGAVLSHNNLLANGTSLVTCWRITSSDRYLAVLPLFHVHGLGNGLISWLISGCRMRLVERFDVTRAVELFEEFRPTLFFGVPTMYVRLLELAADDAQRIGSRMRLFVCGSAPLPASTMESFRQHFGHVILERYGMSETLMNLSNPYEGERRAGTVGFPLPGISARIVDAESRDASDGETGELLVRGPNVFGGYWRRPDADTDAFTPDRWFRTGDLAQRSNDGYFTLCGRRSDLIISGGFNIYPREIEELLLEEAGVREAVVVGVADARRGELPIAYLVADDALDVAALEASCRRQLASFKVPRAFIRVDALPRTALGKVQKHLLPAWTPP